ncbi:hypothetical protein GCM10009601_24270 [Streptomyces thermospinosisporus]|uniref:Uncharacterized protein n=1 Tax=Streptomyces thermospinosisporus TaxID=161482 RepID=A0ABN1YTX6_9ACTN
MDPAHTTEDPVRQHIAAWFDRARATGTPRSAVEERAVHEPRLLHDLSCRPHLAGLTTDAAMCDALCGLCLDFPCALSIRRADLYGMLVARLEPQASPGRGHRGAPLPPFAGDMGQDRMYRALAHRMLWQDTLALDRREMLDAVASTLASMSQKTGLGSPEQACETLLARGRLLRRDAEADTVAFIHVMLRDYFGAHADYFGAHAVIDDGDPAPLIAHAHRDDWAEVVQLTATWADVPLRTRLLTGLMRRADAEPEHRAYLDRLAKACLEQGMARPGDSRRMDESLRTAILRRADRHT